MNQQPSCWCGNSWLEPFSADYLRCPACETLVVRNMPAPEDLLVREDSSDFYGKQYFTRIAEENGLPPIQQRARADIPERCLYWLRSLLKYKLPPGRILELGSAHGGFIAMMRWAGFDATGLDLSPWVSGFARETFDVPVLVGPIESQNLPERSLDAVVLMDVVEHLGDPVATLSRCLSLLKPDGIVFLQTPQYREGKTYREMEDENDPFLQMLKPAQHLYLFSKSSLKLLLERQGMETVSFEPAIFGFYDMALVAGRNALPTFSDQDVATRLESRAGSRLPLALLDLDGLLQDVRARYLESEKDSAARLQNNETLNKLLAEAQAERISHVSQIEALTKWLIECRAECDAQALKLKALEETLAEVRAATAPQALEQIAVSDSEPIAAREIELTEPPPELESTSSQQPILASVGFDVPDAPSLVLGAHADSFRIIESPRPSLLSRLTSSLRRPPSGRSAATPKRRLNRVVVDLTPVLPGGENGGAKIMTLELVRHLARIAKDCEFILLTSPASHAELAPLDSSNVRRILIDGPADLRQSAESLAERCWRLVKGFVPANGQTRLMGAYRRLSRQILPGSTLLHKWNADLLFCPFTAPFFFDPTVPTVSVVYDLQHVYCPQFFEPGEIEERSRNFAAACTESTRMVCISEYVRKTVLENSAMPAERVKSIPILLPRRLRRPTHEAREQVLQSCQLQRHRYLVYPANFWAHKNHELLLTAFGIYRASNPGSDLKLVLTGAPGRRRDELIDASCAMGLSDAVIFPGYLPVEDFSALMEQCLALIFPSLFEGFGMPLLEAMAAGRPILCGNETSLPEVAGDAALLFNAMKPADIVDAITRIEQDTDLQHELIQKGARRLSSLGGPKEMAARYLQVFHEAINESPDSPAVMSGVFDDGWVGERVTVAFGENSDPRDLVLNLTIPEWAPLAAVRILVGIDGQRLDSYSIRRGEAAVISRSLPRRRGVVQLLCSPAFQPNACGMGEDSRALSCRCQSAEIVSSQGAIFTLMRRTYAT
jgi:glycosyltransferase involved in cell wall biosynthesis/2-polyprenyl-3-methyl-5-hydroxy-6-metoxy-1,4-benzoquinol methylase